MQQLITKLQHIPFWLWVFLPAAIFSLVTYLITRNKKSTLQVAILAIIAAWGAAGFHLFEVYLSNHFIGNYDTHGIPMQFSNPGWHMFFTAWPVWVVPSIITALFIYVISFIAHRWYKKSSSKPSYIVSKQKGYGSDEVIEEMESQKLKTKLEQANKQIQQLENPEQLADEKFKELQNEIQTLQKSLHSSKEKVSRILQDKLSMESELKRTKQLAEQLLEKKYGE